MTEREAEVLSVLTLDLTIGEVCEELGITRSTLNGHMKEIITKLGVRTRIGLVVYYLESVT